MRIRTRFTLTSLLAAVVICSFALVAWAALYDYGRGVDTLVIEPGGTYTCPYSTQTVRARYGVDGSTIWDSYGTVKFYGTFRNVAGGTPHYHELNYTSSIDFDQNYRGWNTGHRYTLGVAADPSGLSFYAPMVLAMWCQ